MQISSMRPVLGYFADLLAYPDASLAQTASCCTYALDMLEPESAESMQEFALYAQTTSLADLEEAYTSVFDLEPKCTLYVGYHILGESYKRSAFLLGLNEHFGAQQFTPPGEVPDHLSIIMRCLSVSNDEELDRELIADAVIPALDRMTGRIKNKDDEEEIPEEAVGKVNVEKPRVPYMTLIESLRTFLLAGDFGIIVDGEISVENTEPVAVIS